MQSDQIAKNSEQIAELVMVTTKQSEQIGALDKRVDDLVSAIATLIARIPPTSLVQ